ncbi:hypothetical protein OUZ56_009411 [Daphnia magna]|uniref:BEN domain-containing protein n=1 Tax=Daphnia magna TaxID=35525 RepID=A0ABR0AFW2_9CRUS|nr:hypothetical protein OUZ56_009411 [Daphnia magna]
MAKAEFNKANCERLLINDVCPSMFTMTDTDNEEAETELDGNSHEVAEEKEHSSGGSSLLRPNKEVEEIVITAATVTIGGDTPSESNVHGKVVEAWSGNKILSPSDTKSEIYVVRPDNSFVSHSNPNYLEIHFPDLLAFGRGGTGETRRIKISRKALLAYMLNLSTRQFQEVDFVLPMYDMITRQQVSTISFVHSKIPSRRRGADGTLSTKAEAFGQVSLEDIKKFCTHKINCAKTAAAMEFWLCFVATVISLKNSAATPSRLTGGQGKTPPLLADGG